MLSGARTEAIKQILSQKKAVTVSELSRRFSVSPSTVRRDLKFLESAYLLRRIYGGAIRWEASLYSTLPGEKESYREISKIAKLALSLIKPGDTIYLDGGAITLILARLLKKDMNLSVITNSLKIALELASFGQVNITLTGGNLTTPEFTLQGPLSQRTLEQVYVTKSFIDEVAVDSGKGVTTKDILGAQIKQTMLKKADKKFILVSSKNVGRISFSSVCPVTEVDLIITGKRLSNKVMSGFHKQKVEVRWG